MHKDPGAKSHHNQFLHLGSPTSKTNLGDFHLTSPDSTSDLASLLIEIAT